MSLINVKQPAVWRLHVKADSVFLTPPSSWDRGCHWGFALQRVCGDQEGVSAASPFWMIGIRWVISGHHSIMLGWLANLPDSQEQDAFLSQTFAEHLLCVLFPLGLPVTPGGRPFYR